MSILAQIMQHWFGPSVVGLPDNYVSLDTETSGFSKTEDLIVEVGWTVVVGRRPVSTGHVVINWRGHPAVCWRSLCDRLAYTATKMHAKGQQYPFCGELLEREGVPYAVAVPQLIGFLEDAIRGHVVGNNLWQFDKPRFDEFRQQFGDGRGFDWHDNNVIDTGIFEKASQQNRGPWPGTTLAEWYKRAAAPPFTGSKWSLDFIINKYRLAQRHGLDVTKLHRAAYDSLAVHHAIETFRDIGAGVYQEIV